MADPITIIALGTALAVSGIVNIIVALRNNIKKSTCFGSVIEFKEGTASQTQIPQIKEQIGQNINFTQV